MDFGVVLQTNPPASRTVQLAKLAEAHGFNYVWTFDSHLLWQEPYVIYSAILAETKRVIVGPDGHQPGHAGLDGDGVRLRHAQRDVRQPHRLRHRPRRLGGARHQRQAVDDGGAARVDPRHPRARATRRPVEYNGATLQFPWSRGSELEVWVAAYGPLALKLAGEVGDGFILQLADVDIAAWMIKTVRDAAADGRPRPRRDRLLRRRADVHRRRLGSTCATSAAGSAAWSATTSPTSSRSTAHDGDGARGADRLHRGPRRATTTTRTAGPDNDHVDFVPDEIVDRFCILGTAEEHIAKLEQLQRARRHPVRGLPPARQQGGDDAGLRRDRHPRALRDHVTAKA